MTTATPTAIEPIVIDDINALERKVAKARADFRSGAPMSPRELVEAARTLALHSRNPAEVMAAEAVLNTRTGGVAA